MEDSNCEGKIKPTAMAPRGIFPIAQRQRVIGISEGGDEIDNGTSTLKTVLVTNGY